MDKLIKGALQFMQEGFLEHKDLFKDLKEEQNPHTLFIGCADSRVIPNLITSTLPGELFVIRNIANIIPPYRVKDEYLATTSAIEYALYALNVKNIIICGHSNCGGCKDIPSKKAEVLPNVKKWVSLLDDIKKQVDYTLELSHFEGQYALRSWMIEKANILNSYENLLGYPDVQNRVDNNELSIRAWYFLIETAEIYEYCPADGHFKPLKDLQWELF